MNGCVRASAAVGMLVAALSASGCSTYYEPYELMNNQQIISASCAELDEETAKLNSNVAASNEGAGFSLFSAALLGYAEGYAGTDGSAAYAMADSYSTSVDLGTDWQARLNLVNQVKARKGCY